MTTTWQKRYHDSYLELKNEFDPRLIDRIEQKEQIIQNAPFKFRPLKGMPIPIRKYKAGKIRILYALSTEAPELWEESPKQPEIMFIFVGLRTDKMYKDAIKLLNKLFKSSGI